MAVLTNRSKLLALPATTHPAVNKTPPPANACRVLVENRPDYHFELMEGVVLRYPLPWENFNCSASVSSSVIFDVAHAEDGWFNGELEYWSDYYIKYLRGKVRTREDGVVVTFGKSMPFTNYTSKDMNGYDAVIGVSCGTHDPLEYLSEHPNRFCVLHNACSNGSRIPCDDEDLMSRSCWPSPKFHACHFNPIDFPAFPYSKCNATHNSNTVNICTVGGAKNHRSLAEAFETAMVHGKLNLSDITLSIQDRSDKIPNGYRTFEKTHSLDFIRKVNVRSFLDFEESISQCDLMLPLIQPPSGYLEGKLSGVMTQTMGYKVPSVMHEALHDIYGPYLTAPCKTYNSTQTFADALASVISDLKRTLPDEKRRLCGAEDTGPAAMQMSREDGDGKSQV